MKVQFLGQPYDEFGGWTADWLMNRLADSHISTLDIAVAWAKRSGLSRLRDSLSRFSARGGQASMIVGIDEGGATQQGLRLALELFQVVHVLHENDGGTYHPKAFLAYGPDIAYVLVGSNNLTLGGLFTNNEASLACELELEKPADRELFDQVLRWFELMRSDAGVCKLLTEDLLQTLIADTGYAIGDEDVPRTGRPNTEEDYDGVTELPKQRLFTTSVIPRKGRPPAISRAGFPAASARSGTVQRVPREPSLITGIGSQVPSEYWDKALTASDALHPPGGSSKITGVLRLNKADHDIDHKTYFRQQMFGSVLWAPETSHGLTKEVAVVPFEVIIDGTNQGLQNLRIDYAPSREAKQSNVTTVLHWGTSLSSILRATDYTGARVIIERRTDGAFRLEIM